MKKIVFGIVIKEKQITTDYTEKHRLKYSVKICALCVKIFVFVFFSFVICLGAFAQQLNELTNSAVIKKNKVKQATIIGEVDSIHFSMIIQYDTMGNATQTTMFLPIVHMSTTNYYFYNQSGKLVRDSAFNIFSKTATVSHYEYDTLGRLWKKIIPLTDTVVTTYNYPKPDSVIICTGSKNEHMKGFCQIMKTNKQGKPLVIYSTDENRRETISFKMKYSANDSLLLSMSSYSNQKFLFDIRLKYAPNSLITEMELAIKTPKYKNIVCKLDYEFYE